MKLVLERLESGDQGTFGRLFVPGRLEPFYTLELPWRENKSNVSSIPAGKYLCKWTWSARFGRRMYEVGPVPGRFGIRIHSANMAGDLEKGFKRQLNGCLALGEKIGFMGEQKALLVSRPAVSEFERMMAGQTFELEVKNVTH